MAARAAVATLLGNDVGLQGLGLTPTMVFAANAVDSPPPDGPLFIVIRFGQRGRAFVGVGAYDLTLWVHQPRSMTRDYAVIDEALLRMQEIFSTAEHVSGADGWILTSAAWWSDSAELFDDGYETIARYSTYRAACRPLVTP